MGAHFKKGPVRPLRRVLQGLYPRTTTSMFVDVRCIREKKINSEDCFIIKLCVGPQTWNARSEGPTEIVRHVLFDYFNQKTGLLVHMEGSHFTRIQSNGGDVVYWETTINSFLEDYRLVERIMVAHSGRSIMTLFRFGEDGSCNHQPYSAILMTPQAHSYRAMHGHPYLAHFQSPHPLKIDFFENPIFK